MDWRSLITLKGNPYAASEPQGAPDWRLIGAIACLVLGAVFAVAGLLGLLLGAGRYGFRGILLGIVVAGGGAYLLLTNKPKTSRARRSNEEVEDDNENGAP